MLKRVLLLVLLLLVSATFRASAAPLTMGDSPPKIEVKEFVKGEPVTEFKKGKIYVVEFWATWCGPCRVSIPHLTEMAKKHKDITFVGVSVWEHEADQSKVKPFVAEMGSKMDYRVAMDSIPEGGDGDSGKMATNWMKAANQGGIPTAFIIDKDTKIAWIGHPMTMEKPLDQIEAGKWDIKAAKAEMEKQEAAQKKMQQKMQALGQKFKEAGMDTTKQVAVLDDAFKSDPDLEPQLAPLKLQLLMRPMGDPDKAAAYATHIVDSLLKAPEQLNAFAWSFVDPKRPDKIDPKMLKVALKAAMKADELGHGKDAAIADTLARAYFVNGNTPKAVETQTRAVKLAKGTELEKDLTDTLTEYQKAPPK